MSVVREETLISTETLAAFCRDALMAVGTPDGDAELVAASLTTADARNIGSHGVVRLLPVYVRRLQAGATKAKPDIQVVRRHGVSSLVDGDAGLGQVVGRRAMQLAIATAREQGAGVVGVRNSSHFGTGAFFVEQAVRDGMVGLAMSNATPNMPVAGGMSRFLGTNPFTIGVPGPGERPLMLDMATSVVARGKIVMAEKEGLTIPSGWAIDNDGYSTEDATAALRGAVLAMGGYKGAGLALMIDVLAGVLSGAAFGPHVVDLYDQTGRHQNVGHLFAAIAIDAFMPLAEFRARVGQFIAEVREQPRLPGVERIFLPGEIEQEAELQSRERGIALSAAGWQELDVLAETLGIAPLAARVSSARSGDGAPVDRMHEVGDDALAPG
jgi:LDH2 family malate/lactate/ureidoglycolate dehydrogenase